jgi:hypothetical protein
MNRSTLLSMLRVNATVLSLSAAVVFLAATLVVADETPVPASDSQMQASTPADASASKVRSIRRNEYFYQSYGRKDLFAALVTGDFMPMQGGEFVDVNNADLVGVMWGAADRFALVEDGTGNGYILRVGDKVTNGRITAIQKDSLVAAIHLYGITSRVILRLKDREGRS